MWVYATFEPVAAFGLRPSNTTSSGGKSLVCPTPYAVKMALLDRLIREYGLADVAASFEAVRDMQIWARVPDAVAVNRTFQRVFRPQKSTLNENTGRMDVWTRTIAQREMCFFSGWLVLAFEASDALAHSLPDLLSGINYFGRRGSFMQLVGWEEAPTPPDSAAGYVDLCTPPSVDQLGYGFLQRMDDMRADSSFEDVDVVAGRGGDGGRDSYTVVVPYRLWQQGPGYTLYRREGAVTA